MILLESSTLYSIVIYMNCVAELIGCSELLAGGAKDEAQNRWIKELANHRIFAWCRVERLWGKRKALKYTKG